MNRPLLQRSVIFSPLHRQHTRMRWIISTAIALVAVLFLLFVWFFLLKMGNDSMAPTLQKGDLLLVDRLSIYYRNVQRTDIIVFRRKQSKGLLVKRVVATEGETVEGKDGYIWIDEKYRLMEDDYGPIHTDTFPLRTVPEGCVFVLSDDRQYGEDSRETDIGCIPISDIVGVVYIRLTPLLTFFQ